MKKMTQEEEWLKILRKTNKVELSRLSADIIDLWDASEIDQETFQNKKKCLLYKIESIHNVLYAMAADIDSIELALFFGQYVKKG